MNSHRKMTPKGHMSGNGSGPPIMMMPDHIRATFMPDPPLRHLPPPKRKRHKVYTADGLVPVPGGVGGSEDPTASSSSASTSADRTTAVKRCVGLTGVATYMAQFERTPAPPRMLQPTAQTLQHQKRLTRKSLNDRTLQPLIAEYRTQTQTSSSDKGLHNGTMNCYNTLFVGRLAYEVTERKLLREFEAFGAVKDVQLVTCRGGEREGKSRGYAFVEFEQEDDMKRAYRAADGMMIEGKEIVVDVERGHTVPNWLPRRLGGGLGGTRLGSKEKNVTRKGRFDPSRPEHPPSMGMGMAMGGPAPSFGGYSSGGGGGGGGGRGDYRPPLGGPPGGPGPRGGPPGGGGGGGGMDTVRHPVEVGGMMIEIVVLRLDMVVDLEVEEGIMIVARRGMVVVVVDMVIAIVIETGIGIEIGIGIGIEIGVDDEVVLLPIVVDRGMIEASRGIEIMGMIVEVGIGEGINESHVCQEEV